MNSPAKILHSAPRPHFIGRLWQQSFAGFLLFVVLHAPFCPHWARAQDWPFNNPANWGGTGLMEIPNARVLDDGVMRFGVAQALPYRWYTGGMGIFPGLEFTGRFTAITNIPATALGPAYGSNKDKAFDLKYQILPESKRFPALALGLHDFHGTALFEAQYLALSRQLYPFDFTIGFGRGRLEGPIDIPLLDRLGFFDDIGVFGGFEWVIHPKIQFLAEYNPIQYELDKPSARGVPEGADWPFNFGMRFMLLPGLQLGLSYQRGDTLGLQLHVQTELGKPMLPQQPDPPAQAPVDRGPSSEKDLKKIVERIYEGIQKAGFKDASVFTDGRDLIAEFTNGRYLSDQKAAGRVLRILLYNAPPGVKKLRVVLKRRNFPIVKVSVSPDHLEKYIEGRISSEVFDKLVDVKKADHALEPGQDALASIENEEKLSTYFNVKPDFETYLNDPSGVFKYRVGIKPFVNFNLWKGAMGYARYDLPFYSNISSSNATVEGAVRSDSWKYFGRDYSFDHLMVDQVFRLTKGSFVRVSGGYLEKMYAGFGGEFLHYLGDGNLALGFEADWVRKRVPGSQFALMDFDAYTLLANAYYHVNGPDITLYAQYGRFMAGDVGWKFTVSRQYDTGLVFGAWYSITDTDDVPGSFNKGYHDKGVFLSLPIRMFLTRDSRLRYSYAVSPWTRDVAATPDHWQSLFGLGAELMPGPFRAKLDEMKE